jgi:hypothetical protein
MRRADATHGPALPIGVIPGGSGNGLSAAFEAVDASVAARNIANGLSRVMWRLIAARAVCGVGHGGGAAGGACALFVSVPGVGDDQVSRRVTTR